MTRKQVLIMLALSSSMLAGQAIAQDYTPAESYYDLSDQPETGMFTQGGSKPGEGGTGGPPPPRDVQMEEIVVGPATFTVNYPIFDSFDTLPDDVVFTREPIQSFERPEGGTHYYEVVLVNSMNVSWVQAAILAESEGGYLASLTSAEENAFVFDLVNDDKYFWEFPDDYTPDSHYRIKIGPFLGGVRVSDTEDSFDGWQWLSGEEWGYTNWVQNLDDGVIDRDPRNNTQPNGGGNQNAMGFGELNVPVSTWGDYWDTVAQYGERGMPSGYNMGFIIEYDAMPG
ncbi:C-type lectin-like domain-containing protein [Celeribacter sp. ULVN23_4]